MSGLVIRQAELDGHLVDLRLANGRISAVAPTLVPDAEDDVLDAAGGAVLPGLHDHHIHLTAFAAARHSIPLGPPEINDAAAFTAALRDADRTYPAGQWLRGTGYHESVAGELDRSRLDAVVAHRPLRIQHRSGALWILNTAATRAAGLDGPTPSGVEREPTGAPTGRVYGLDGWLRDRVPQHPPNLAGAARQLLAYGVTGLTDATPTERADDIAILAAAVADGRIPQRLIITGGPQLPAELAPELERGPVKLVIGDYDLPPLDDVADRINAAHRRRRPVAIHCVTRVALLLALAAWDDVGSIPGDRVEHAAVAGPAEAARLAAHRLTVVTQPGFVAERGDSYLAEVDPYDLPDLWPCRSLLQRGIAVGGSTDAPFGHPDPWYAIATATTRRTRQGRVLGDQERINARRALQLFLTPPDAPGGSPTHLTIGQPADLCLLHVPLNEALHQPSSTHVAATVRHGQLQFP